MPEKPARQLVRYKDLLDKIKSRIRQGQTRAVLSANAELVRLYWDIGRTIAKRQKVEGWGAKVIDRLARDLKAAFPTMKGFSGSNLKYMRYFAEHCPEMRIGQQPADQLPWFHIVTLLTRLESDRERSWYATQTIKNGWSRPTLQSHIKNSLYLRQGKAVSNFTKRLPDSEARRAHEALKDPYLFDFLGLGDDALERDIEDALIRHVTRFLLELGAGFAFVGRQYPLEVGDSDFYIDLLFVRSVPGGTISHEVGSWGAAQAT